MRQSLEDLLHLRHHLHRLRNVLVEAEDVGVVGELVLPHHPLKLAVLKVVEGNGQEFAEDLDTRLSDIGILDREHAAYAAAGAGVELDEVHAVDMFVLELLEHADHVLYAVGGEIFVAQHRRRLASRGSPADAHKSRLPERLDLGEVIHNVGELGINL